MTEDPLFVEKNNTIATITLNRPESLNALNEQMAARLREALTDAEYDEKIRCVVIKGAGEHFCAGGDVKFFAQLLEKDLQEKKEITQKLLKDVHGAIISIHRMPKPVLVSVSGAVAGFGLSLMMAADLVVSSENAYFTMAYTRIGVTPDGGSTFYLPRSFGLRKAKEIMFLNPVLKAEELLAKDLINWVVPDQSLADKTQEIAVKLSQGPTGAYGLIKEIIDDSFMMSLSDQLLREEKAFLSAVSTNDFSEGVKSFIAKRQPNFQGE